MPSSTFGGAIDAWVAQQYTLGGFSLLAQLRSPETVTVWESSTGVQITALLLDGVPVETVTAPAGSGQIPAFVDPAGRTSVWVSIDGGITRYRLDAPIPGPQGTPGIADDASVAAAVTAPLTKAALDTTYGTDTGVKPVGKGELILNLADYASLSAAIVATPAGGTLYIPAGTTTSVASLTVLNKDMTIIGDGPSVSIIDAGANVYGFSPASAGSGARITFRNIGFTGSTSAIFLLSKAFTHSVQFIDCTFSGFPFVAIQTFGTNLTCVRCTFSSDGTPGNTNGIQHLRGAQSIILRDCAFRFLERGFYCTDYDGAAAHVDITGCTFDGGWMYLKSTASNSGGTVTYGAVTLTDTAAAFGTLVFNSTVRALAVKQAGTVTAISSTKITDTAANFTTAGVLRGDIIRTSTGWGVVDEVVSATVVKIEEWLSLSTYAAIPAPVTTTAYTIYGLVIGRIVSNTSTVLTVDVWRDWNGTAVTPASGTLYELAPKADYQGIFMYRADKVRITNNTVRRCWADQMSIQLCRSVIIANNIIYDGQDVGLTLGQPTGQTPGAIVTGNRISHQGTAGIWAGNVYYSTIAQNNVYEPNWISLSTATYAGITVDGGSDNNIANNIIQRVLNPSATKAIHVLGTATNMRLLDNMTLGYATQDVMVTGTGVTGVTGRFQKDTKITLVTAAIGPVGDFMGTGSPDALLSAGIGSTFRRTDGIAGTCFYVKESGTGNVGWIAK